MVDLLLAANGGVALEWRVLVGICVLGGMCTFQTAFVELCVEVHLSVGTSAERVWRGSFCAQRGGGGVGVGGLAPQTEPPVGVARPAQCVAQEHDW